MSTETDYTDTAQARFEQRLRRELEHVTVRVPAGLIPRAHQRYRRRLVTIRVTAISGTAAVIAGAATIVAMAGPSLGLAHGAPRPGAAASQSPASRIPAAGLQPPPPGDGLSGAQAAREISWTRTATTSASGATSVSDTFSYGGTTRTVGFSEKGTVLYDQQATTVTGANGSRTAVSTDVNYALGTVSRGTGPGAGQAQRQALCPAAELGLSVISASTLIASAGALLACPGLTETRGVRIDGINAITISTSAIGVRTTDWLNAATGLPIQTTIVPLNPRAPSAAFITTQFGFLSPAKANLGYLSTFVPPGFRQSTSLSVSAPERPR